HAHGVKPGNIVGAIANEAGLDSKYIGRVDIYDDHTVLDLPEGMPKELFEQLKTVWVAGQQLRISRLAKAPFAGGKRSADKKLTAAPPRKEGAPKPHRKG